MNALLFPTGPCVVALVVVAMSFDLHTRRIPNWLVATALVVALPVEIIANGLPIGPIWWLTGLLTGGLLFLPGYLIRMLGAGDVKLMAAVGALMGPRGALEAAMAATVVGGLISFVALLQKRRLRRGVASAISTLITMSADDASNRADTQAAVGSAVGALPYGVAIAIGSVVAIAINA
ncbi:peptidase A24 [Trinickia dabaoshanensis]|uniref:Peptidase A24 n=1 Tax=Trinickia dabaoshanensis TaxID=564714 RepID=A0A2N7VY78_9BURK|nr:prepilin peptidase [Trinickia dabaoshanensis]PMS22119.1 peptidase A24 [Trinickia dabaoshanensis]